MSAYNRDFRLLINAGLSYNEAKSIAEQTHWDRLKAEYDALREARRSGDTVRAGITRSNINEQYGKFTPFYNRELVASATETARSALKLAASSAYGHSNWVGDLYLATSGIDR